MWEKPLLRSRVETSALLRENARAQADIRQKIKAVDAEINRLTGERTEGRQRANAQWREFKGPSWKVRITAPDTAEANWAALGIASACEGCGFRVVGASEYDVDEGRGVRIETGLDTAQLALLVQDAFGMAGVEATLLINEYGRSDSLTVHVRDGGI
jgi:hypothetical protein